ncbi:hypothetical protein RhiJN_01952 [Ceratobasidium sp. AG-Ba]|nr:hypothetical protein RhiJN_01952 [Ceratobasidium sp. AG-Ba]
MSGFSTSSLSTSDASFARRVKPLPKRRRNSGADSDGDGYEVSYVPSVYYHPIHSSRVNALKRESNATPQSSLTPRTLSFPARPRTADDGDVEGDHSDHLQQPNNTKKRKVPVTTIIGITRRGSSTLADSDRSGNDKFGHARVNLSGSIMGTSWGATSDTQQSRISPVLSPHQKKGSPITSATLRLKDQLAAHRKMMSSTIEESIDPLALELALSSAFETGNFIVSGGLAIQPIFLFLFLSLPCAKYALVKKAVADLRLRFQAELRHQNAASANPLPKKLLQSSTGPNVGQRSTVEPSTTQIIPATVPQPEGARPPTKPAKPKKKKRSTLANASNPHHLRNYVPSRVPQPNGCPASAPAYGQSSNAGLGPLALKFLSATLPPRRKGRPIGSETTGSSLILPESEWICPFCEYNLFYGDEAAMQRAVKNRRKILRRRRKVKARAAAAANGAALSASQPVSESESEQDEDLLDYAGDVIPTPIPLQKVRSVVRRNYPGPHPGG